MNHALPPDLKCWVEAQVRRGEYASEQEVVEAALRSLQSEEADVVDRLIDDSFVAYCAQEADVGLGIDEVRDAASVISGSMAEFIIEEDRADRF